jgi:hypothetical protein
VIALLAVAAVHFASLPRTIWEYDESFFAAAVERYQPLLHHPPPPGYPLFIGFTKVMALFTPDAFTALRVTSMLAVALGFLAFIAAFAAITDLRTGILGAALLYLSPAVLISGTLPQSDAGALALFGLAIWSCTQKDRAVLCGVLCAVVIGWRLQFSVAVVPMFLAAVVMMRTWRERFLAVAAFGLTCLAWFVPLVLAAGGPASYWKWLSGQAAYYAAHDADLSRSGHSATHIALRFIAHPWGPKWLSLPLLVLALLGVRRNARMIPLAAGALVYLGFALATMDPADAVRYAIPSLPLVALLAASAHPSSAFGTFSPQRGEKATYGGVPRESDETGDPHLRMRGYYSLKLSLVILYAIGSVYYAFPVLHARATSPSPPFAATQWIKSNVPRNAIVLYDLPLAPHAQYLLRKRRSMRIDAGLAKYGGDPAVPLVILADGERGDARGITFRWPDTDTYRKLTREHYGAVSVIPLPPSDRFRVVQGVFAPERTRDGLSWRWVGARGVIDIAAAGHARLTFRAPPEYPLAENRIRVNGTVVTVRRNESVQMVVQTGDGTIAIEPERTFVPAQIRGANNRDRRTLSVMLTRVERLDAPPAAAGSPPGR